MPVQNPRELHQYELCPLRYALSPAQIKVLYNQNSAVRFGPVTGRQ